MTPCPACHLTAGDLARRACDRTDCPRQPATLHAIAPGSLNPLTGRVLPVASVVAPRRAGGGAFMEGFDPAELVDLSAPRAGSPLDRAAHRALVDAGYAPLADYVREQSAGHGEANDPVGVLERVAVHGEAA